MALQQRPTTEPTLRRGLVAEAVLRAAGAETVPRGARVETVLRGAGTEAGLRGAGVEAGLRQGPVSAGGPRRGRARRPRLLAGSGVPAVLRQHAIQWQDTRVPLVGNLRAVGWLPTVLVAACAAALMHLLQTSGVATTGYDIQRLQVEKSDWTLRNEQLTLELAKLESLVWIESEAVGRLGMVKPEHVVHLRIDPSGQ